MFLFEARKLNKRNNANHKILQQIHLIYICICVWLFYSILAQLFESSCKSYVGENCQQKQLFCLFELCHQYNASSYPFFQDDMQINRCQQLKWRDTKWKTLSRRLCRCHCILERNISLVFNTFQIVCHSVWQQMAGIFIWI